MYDLLHSFVNHIWNTSSSASSTEQQIFLYGSIAFALIAFVCLSDLTISVFKAIFKKGGRF